MTKQDKLNKLADAFKSVSDPNRLRILCLASSNKNACVSDIAKQLDQSLAIVSYHLNALAEAGFLVAKRKGKNICYTLSDDALSLEINNLICKYK